MATDFALPIRRVILPWLKADGSVTTYIPAARLYSVTVPANPAFPFGRYGASISAPFRASCLDSSTITVAIHAFVKDVTNAGGQVTMTAEDLASKVSAAIGASLDDVTLALEDGQHKARISWTGSNILIDGDEPGAWHAVVNLRVEVSG